MGCKYKSKKLSRMKKNEKLAQQLCNERKISAYLRTSLHVEQTGWSLDKEKLAEAIEKLNKLGINFNAINGKKNIEETGNLRRKQSVESVKKDSCNEKQMPSRSLVKGPRKTKHEILSQEIRDERKTIEQLLTSLHIVETGWSLDKEKLAEAVEKLNEIEITFLNEIGGKKEIEETGNLRQKQSVEIVKKEPCYEKQMPSRSLVKGPRKKKEEISQEIHDERKTIEQLRTSLHVVQTAWSVDKEKLAEAIEKLNKIEITFNEIIGKKNIKETGNLGHKQNVKSLKKDVCNEMQMSSRSLVKGKLTKENKNENVIKTSPEMEILNIEVGGRQNLTDESDCDSIPQEQSDSETSQDDMRIEDTTAHYSLREPDGNSISCPLCCNESFPSQESLKYHLLSFVENIFCSICNQRYDNITLFISHLEMKCDGHPKYESEQEDLRDSISKQAVQAATSSNAMFTLPQETPAIISFKMPAASFGHSEVFDNIFTLQRCEKLLQEMISPATDMFNKTCDGIHESTLNQQQEKTKPEFEKKKMLEETCKMPVEDTVKGQRCETLLQEMISPATDIFNKTSDGIHESTLNQQKEKTKPEFEKKKMLEETCKMPVEDTVKVFEMPSNNAEKCKNYRNRKKKDRAPKVKVTQISNAERCRMYRLRRKQLAQLYQSSMIEDLYIPSSSNSQATFESSPQPVTTELNAFVSGKHILPYDGDSPSELISVQNQNSNNCLDDSMKDVEDIISIVSTGDVEMDDNIAISEQTELVDNEYLCSGCNITFTSIADHIEQYHVGEEVQVTGPAEDLKEKLSCWEVVTDVQEQVIVKENKPLSNKSFNERNLQDSVESKLDQDSIMLGKKKFSLPYWEMKGYWIKSGLYYKFVTKEKKMKLLDPTFVPPIEKLKTTKYDEIELNGSKKKTYFTTGQLKIVQLVHDEFLRSNWFESQDELNVYIIDKNTQIGLDNLGPIAKVIDDIPRTGKDLQIEDSDSKSAEHKKNITEQKNANNSSRSKIIGLLEVELGSDRKLTIENINFPQLPNIPANIVPFVETKKKPPIPLLKNAKMLKWYCLFCCKTMSTYRSAVAHYCSKCKYCEQRLSWHREIIKKHFLQAHPDKKFDEVVFSRPTREDYDHPVIEEKNKFLTYCEICKKIIADKEIHAKFHEENKYICEVCGRSYDTELLCSIHQATHNMKFPYNEPYACNICKLRFSKKVQLKSHLLQHDSNYDTTPYQCRFCVKRFKKKNCQILHERIHNNVRPHVCKECGKCFRDNKLLRIHYLRIHSGKKENLCTICGKAFASKTALKSHLYTHSNERPFKCPYCEKAFKCNPGLIAHKKNHELPFKCPFCPLRFSSLGGVRIHLPLHEPEAKGFHCSNCTAIFRRNYHLTLHMKKAHNIEIEPILIKTKGKQFKDQDEDSDESL